MITETRQSRTRLLQYYERRPRRRHHTLDNATLDKFNFVCVPLHHNERHPEQPASPSSSPFTVTSSKDFTVGRPAQVASPTRRVRFECDLHDKCDQSGDEDRSAKKYSTHRVEFQIPIHREINPWLNVDCASTPTKARSMTSQKIDVQHNGTHNTFRPAHTDLYSSPMNDSDKARSQWYKEMYCHIHKSPESKTDEPVNPYKPTYAFPDEFDGDLDRMEDYIRKAASSHQIDTNPRPISSSPVRMSTATHYDSQSTPKRNSEKITRFSDQLMFASASPTIERAKPISVTTTASPVTVNSRSHAAHPTQAPTASTDDEQKSIYRRVLRGGDIPSVGLQKRFVNNRERSSEQSSGSSQRNEQSPSQFGVNGSQPIYTALALHNFQAQSNRELSFRKGETILVKRRINDDWLEGELHGLTGIFPVNYVELLPYETPEREHDDAHGEAIVKYDYRPQKPFELQLSKGEKVVLLRKLDQNRYEARVHQDEGILLAEYVEIITEPKDNRALIPDQRVESDTRATHEESPVTVCKAPKSALKNPTAPKPSSDFSVSMQKCQVLYDYTPQHVDELEIHVGDIISILEKCDDGWYCGIMDQCVHGHNMKFGTFPGNYVKILPD